MDWKHGEVFLIRTFKLIQNRHRFALPTLWSLICLFFLLKLEVLNLSTSSLNEPYLELSGEVKNATYEGSWFRFPLAESKIRLSADDCLMRLKIDQQIIHADDTCTSCKNCDPKDFAFKSSPLKLYKVEASILNLGGKGGLYNTRARPSIPLALLTVFILGLFLIYKVKDPFITLPTLALYLIVYIYFRDTDLFERQHDLQGHIEYIQSMVRNKRIPLVDEGWETFHPPFYYLLALPFSKSALALQFFGFLLVTSTMSLWALLVSKLRRHPLNSILIVAFLGVPNFWFLAARINNDVIMPLFGVIVTAFWAKWHLKSNHSNHHPSIKAPLFLGITLSLMLFTKVSAVSTYGAAGLASLIVLRKNFNRNSLRELFVAYLPGALVMIAHLYRTYSQTHHWVYQPQMTSALAVGNSPSVFLSFDLYQYFTAVSAHPFEGGVRQHFWEYLLISAVSGEFTNVWHSPILNFLLRLLVLLGSLAIIRGAYLCIKKPTPLGTYAVTTSLFAVLFLLYFRIYGSNGLAASCQGDARFLVLAYPSFAILIATSLKAAALRFSLLKLQSSERI